MQSVFNVGDDNFPFFSVDVRPETFMRFSAVHSESHVPGRHLNALLNAEDVTGVHVDEEGIENHARAAFFSYSGLVPLPLNRDRVGGELSNFRAHNMREGFHALYALAKYRDSRRARELTEASIETVFALWDGDKGWDSTRFDREHGIKVHPDQSFISGLARAIGPLVKIYRATGYSRALELAIVLKEKAVGEFFLGAGAYDPDTFGTHVHSVTCVMSSLAQLADLTSDANLMGRVKSFYDNGLWEIRDEIGWSPEGSASRGANVPDQGEMNNSGDILETALILGRWGYPEYFQDAERILRGHILPAQLRDNSFIEDPPNPEGEDGKRNVAARLVGAFGFPAPYGHDPVGQHRMSFNLDVVGGTVASLCEAYREATRSDQSGNWVNLLFDHETPDVKVESPYTHQALTITPKSDGPLFVRLPSWVQSREVGVKESEGGRPLGNGYLFFAQPSSSHTITIEFPLTIQEIVLKHRTRDIRVRLRGDEVVGMDNFGAGLTFFDPID